MAIYVVKANDTVNSIAGEYNIPSTTIISDNQLVPPYQLVIGQALYLDTMDAQPSRSLAVGGYAYPFISNYVLRETLPYLTDLYIFSYGFTDEGYLIPPNLPVDRMLETSKEFGKNSILVLTPLDSRGRFNNNLITTMVQTESVKNNLINQLIATIQAKGYQGADIDFEYIKATDRDAFTAFVQEAASRLNALGYTCSIALAPKIADDQPGLLYQGKDFPALGAAVNHALLMTYEWGYKYGPPMAVAPLNKVRQVVDYAITQIPNTKLDLGIPNYGYDWPLPYVRNETIATTIGNVEAIQIAIANNARIEFDETAQSPYFYYTRDGMEHVVWFEDVRSIQRKFDLVKEYGLRGVGYWQIMRWWRANWLLLVDNFTIQ